MAVDSFAVVAVEMPASSAVAVTSGAVAAVSGSTLLALLITDFCTTVLFVVFLCVIHLS